MELLGAFAQGDAGCPSSLGCGLGGQSKASGFYCIMAQCNTGPFVHFSPP